MKIRLTSPTFDASAQTVTHPSFSDVTLSGIQLIVNVTDQIIIYNFADTTKGGTLAGDVLTLEYDTTTMSDTDELMVLVEDGSSTQPISASSLPLPTGASTSANQTTIIGHLDGVETSLTNIDADLGATSDAASTVGGAGSLNAKARLMTTQLDAIQTGVQLLDNAIAGSEMQVDIVASLPAGTNNIGDVDVLSMPGIVVEDAAETAGGNLMAVGTVRRDTAASSAGTTGDNATLNTDSVGALWTRDTSTQVDDAAFTPATGRIMPVGFLADETATDSVDEGDAGAARITLDRKQIIANYAHTAGGATPYKLNSAASTNATSVKASSGQIYSIMCTNTNAAVRYLKLYNKASAPTVGTDTPVQTYAVPGATTGGGFVLSIPVGMAFSTGIAFAITTGAADSDTGAVALNEIIVNLTWL